MRWLVSWCGASRRDREGERMSNLARRKLIDRTMTALCALCAVVAVTALVVILGYIFAGGLRAFSLGFLINTPKPIGEPNSGIANAIVGSLIMIGLGTLFGMPVGVLAGVYLSEFGSNRLGYAIRFLIDT